jgi:hypothetical protein
VPDAALQMQKKDDVTGISFFYRDLPLYPNARQRMGEHAGERAGFSHQWLFR